MPGSYNLLGTYHMHALQMQFIQRFEGEGYLLVYDSHL